MRCCRRAALPAMVQSSKGSSGSSTRPLSPVRELLDPGRMVDRYRICRLAGMGGMGEVYLAWDSLLERYVALKAVRPSREEPEATLERFRREALALAQLNHPHVCQVYDLVQSEVGTFMAMEWLEGRTLDQAMADLDARARLRIAREAAEGLEAAHAKGLVHRDLKPSNLMVDAKGAAKILDFGLARHGALDGPSGPVAQLDALLASRETVLPLEPQDEQTGPIQALSLPSASEPLTQEGFFMGSPRYASPEQIRGILAGPPADVFALGVVAWELLHGEHPFPGEGKDRFKAILANDRRAPKRRLPRRMASLLDRMLAPLPDHRPSAAEVAAELRALQRPLAQGWWIALGAAAMLLLTFGGYLALGRGVVADLIKERPARVAILPVENRSGDPGLEAELRWVLPDGLGSVLRTSPRLVPLQADGLSSGEAGTARAAARKLGADLVLASTLRKAQDGGWNLTYTLQDRSGNIRHRGSVSAEPGPESLLQALPRIAGTDLLKAVDPLLGHGPQGAGASLSPEALKAYALGRDRMDRGEFREARDHLREACERAPHFATAAVHYGICLQKLGEPGAELAIQWGRWAARAAGNRRAEIQALTQQALLGMERGQWEASRATFDEAMGQAQAAQDEDFQSAILNNLGYLALERKRFAEAEEHLNRALVLQQRLGKVDDEILTLNNLAVLAKQRGEFDQAARHYHRVLSAVRESGDRWAESVAENNLGDVALAQGAFPEAARRFEASLRLKQAIGHRVGTIIPLANLGILARVQGDGATAEARFRESLALCRELKRKPLEPVILWHWGALDLAQRRPAEAQRHFQEAARLQEQLQDAEGRAQSLAGWAEAVLLQRGDRAQAERLLKQARTLNPECLFVLRAEAELARLRNQPEAAQALLEQALARAAKEAPEEVPDLRARRAR